MRPNIQGPKKTRTLLLPPCVIALAISSSLVAAETTEPSITATQYAGGDKVAIRWRAGLEGTDRDCGHYAYESPYGDGTEYRNSGEHAIFARAPGGEYALAVNLRGTSDLMWFGAIPGLSASTPVELQVRLKDLHSDEYCEISSREYALVDTSTVDTPPSFSHTGDVLVSNFEIQQSEPSTLYAPRYWATFSVENWASLFSDGDDQNQTLLDNHVYRLPYGLSTRFNSDFGGSFNDLRGTTVDAPSINTIDYSDNLEVYQVCNTDVLGNNWIGSCSDEVPFIVSAGPNAPGAENAPSFIMSNSLVLGEDYSMQELPEWASNLDPGANATPSSALQFHTLWLSNSVLFEVAPWISYPSGTLRFKFKEGVSGTSRVFISLADWDLESPENQAHYFSREYPSDISPDHSRIQTINISVGINPTARVISAGARGIDLTHAPITDDEIESSGSGGGGAGGFLLFGLLGLRLMRRR